ncbi:hypothetical protein RSM48_003298 [Klebsiella pneumoniae]|nr:hypothetical protein [Klebsiella pneumoniae]
MKNNNFTPASSFGKNTSVDANYYLEHGFADVRELISKEMVEYLRDINNQTKSNSAFDSFKRNTYNVAIEDEKILSFIRTEKFADLVKKLGYEDCVFTDGIIFETDSNSVGFDWHIGVTSFKYIYPEDRAFSIWIALDDVDPEKQDGGMSLLSTQAFSGHEFYKLQSKVTKSLTEGKYKIPAIFKTVLGPRFRTEEQKKFKELYPFIQEKIPHLFSESLYISGFARNLYDSESVRYRLAPGDAIAFDKDVFHKSNRFLPGPQLSRRAFVMRFIDVKSRYNQVNSDKTGGDVSVLVNKMIAGNGNHFDIQKGTVIRTTSEVKK